MSKSYYAKKELTSRFLKSPHGQKFAKEMKEDVQKIRMFSDLNTSNAAKLGFKNGINHIMEKHLGVSKERSQ